MGKPKHGREVYEKAAELLEYNPETGEFKWKVYRGGTCKKGWFAGCVNTQGYCQIGIYRTLLFAHRLAWYLTHGEVPNQIDHINGDRSDNSIGNLRSCSNTQNSRNRTKVQSNNTSGVSGVSWAKRDSKWLARIKVDNKYLSLGRFTHLDDAKQARIEAEKKYFGEFAPQRLTEA
tara:strand:- start:583 stop:1107 length:525 start_codon:yes stop_codon:yes gene_type:complete